jgi:hypothetical protein
MQHQATQPIGHEYLNLLPDAAILQVVRSGMPIFVGERNSKGGLSFKCPACKRKHHHKAGPGLRNPHCFTKPPVHQQGYYLLAPIDEGVVAVHNIKRSKVEAFLLKLGGAVFGVDFIKKDDSFRSMTARLEVKAALKGGENKSEALDRPYLTVYDMAAHGYRNVNLDTITRIRAQGRVYDVVD